jgi:hypothetical protein
MGNKKTQCTQAPSGKIRYNQCNHHDSLYSIHRYYHAYHIWYSPAGIYRDMISSRESPYIQNIYRTVFSLYRDIPRDKYMTPAKCSRCIIQGRYRHYMIKYTTKSPQYMSPRDQIFYRNYSIVYIHPRT